MLLAVGLPAPLLAQSAVDRVVVRADRLPDDASRAPFTVQVIEKKELEEAPQLRLDDLLRAEIPGFSLFRRNSSRAANPTTQGVTLRNFGPSGAGRTLVLLDGIPLNDPFAGYVLWNQLPPSSLSSIIVQSGGGAGLFGNAAIAGTIFASSAQPDRTGAMLETTVGNQETYGVAATGDLVEGPVALSLFGERFSTAGYPVVEAGRRGRIDTEAGVDSDLLQFAGRFQLSGEASLQVRARRFHEERNNGTVFTRNETTGNDASALLTLRLPRLEAELAVAGWFQRRKFRSTFSSVSADRRNETPALDQYDVPANAAGGSAVWQMAPAPDHRLTLGSDLRWVEGETNEFFRWTGAGFSRGRNAGGRQLFLGIFAEETWQATPATMIVGGARLDYWRLFDGMRREFDRVTGAALLRQTYPDRDGVSLNGRTGAEWQVNDHLTLRGAGYTGFRVPTLNELYRPFRVGNDITEANAGLEPERLLGGEAGADWQPVEPLRLSAVGFFNALQDAIGNVTIGRGPGTFDPGGFVPAGGVLRQRRNVDLVLAPGVEGKMNWRVARPLILQASYIFTCPTIAEAEENGLEGNLLAQTPQHVAVAGLEWRPDARFTAQAQVRYTGAQFEDDQNSRRLAGFTTVDLGMNYEIGPHLSVAARIENLFDTEIETGKTADGLTQIGSPRLLTLQARTRF